MNGNHLGDFFPELYEQAIAFNQTIVPVALILATTGIIAAGARAIAGDIRGMLQGLSVAIIISVLIPTFPGIANDIQLATYALVEQAGSNPSDTSKKFGDLIVNNIEEGDSEVGFFDILTDKNGGVGKALLYVFLLLSSFLALIIQYLIFIAQQMLTVFGIAMAPIFLTMLMVAPLREIATRYFLSLVAIMMWPLGWGFADITTTALLERAVQAELYSEGTGAFFARTSQSLFFAFAISIWLVVSTIAAPYVVQKVITTGANAGAAMMQRIGSAVGLGISYGAAAGTTAYFAGGGKTSSAIAAGAGALGGILDGARGGGGFLIPTTIGIAAANLAPKSSSSAKTTDYNKKAAQIFE